MKTFLLGATAAMALIPAFAEGVMAERGASGHVNIIYWQAPSIMNPYLSSGTKEMEAASLVLEPLARYDETGTMVAWLAENVPTVANGGVSSDLTTITWKLKPALKWSDGSDVTSNDVIFSWKYCSHPEGGCAQGKNMMPSNLSWQLTGTP